MNDLTVLVVDDNRDLAESLAEILEIRGFRSDMVFNGEDAIIRAQNHDCDLILMDVVLPGLNGVETQAAIREFLPDARILMMTGYSANQLIDQAMEGGAIQVLKKPLDLDGLVETIQTIKQKGH